MTLKSNGEDGLYPHDATATRYLSGDTDWENGLLLINLTKLWDKTDFSQEGVTVDVLFDGKNYENVLESTAGFASTRGRLILRLGIDEPEAGEYTAKVTVKKNGEVLYNTNEITVKSDKVVDTDVALSVVAPTEAKKPGETFTVDVKASGIPEKGMNGWQYGRHIIRKRLSLSLSSIALTRRLHLTASPPITRRHTARPSRSAAHWEKATS